MKTTSKKGEHKTAHAAPQGAWVQRRNFPYPNGFQADLGHSNADLGRLPEFLQRELENPPFQGDGVHSWLFKTSRQLHEHFSIEEICDILCHKIANCGRHVSKREIEDAVRNSEAVAWRPRRATPQSTTHTTTGRTNSPTSTPTWPSADRNQIETVVRSVDATEADLWELSPIRFEGDTVECIHHLFPDDSLVCAGPDQYSARTLSKHEWGQELNACRFVVPNLMIKRAALTQSGRLSPRSKNNVGPRRFLVVEFDLVEGEGIHIDHQACLHIHLARQAPLAMVLYSGGKSLHGWYYAHEVPETKLRAFMREAVTLGADRATWTTNQWVRIPMGTRENNRLQRVLYFNAWNLGDGK